MSTETGTLNLRQPGPRSFWFWQIAPPALMFWVFFGRFEVASGLLIVPMFVSLITLVRWLWTRQFRRLLRPVLTVALALVNIGMGNYYKTQSEAYVRELAQEMKAQCDRDGECRLPRGEWKSDDREHPYFYRSMSPGWVPFPLRLSFQDDADARPAGCLPAPRPPCASANRPPGKHTSFHLMRMMTDHSYEADAGVGRPVSTSGG